MLASFTFGLGSTPQCLENRPITTIQVSGRQTQALFDTGSAISLLDWNAFLALKIRPALVPVPIKVCSANKTPVELMGQTYLTVQIGSRLLSKKFVIAKRLASECIIGMDIILEEGITFDMKKRAI